MALLRTASPSTGCVPAAGTAGSQAGAPFLPPWRKEQTREQTVFMTLGSEDRTSPSLPQRGFRASIFLFPSGNLSFKTTLRDTLILQNTFTRRN